MENNSAAGTAPGKTMTIEELQQKHQEQIALIEKKHLETLHGVIRNYERQLQEKQSTFEKVQTEAENTYHHVVNREIRELKQSWTWKIGFAQTAAIRLLINFLRNPYRFFTSSTHRWYNIYYFQPAGKPSATPDPPQVAPPVAPAPAARELTANINPDLQNFMCVLDTFTQSCFAPEFNIIAPSPENWKKAMESFRIDGVFVESAWHGNNDTWEGLTSNYAGPRNLEAMTAMTGAARKAGITTFFWNKEDPVHYSRFIETARLFDHVFTSDAEIIPKYRGQLGHSRVYALPFAAQHKIHHPVRENSRRKSVSFAGTYYNFTHVERKIDMDHLLKPAMDFGLEIFDRNFGATGIQAEQFGFPAIYKKAVKGKLDYTEMLRAYRDFKVYLNVNSVKYSSTMFARRVFELLACGTPVISNYSKGIVDMLGEGTVFISESEEDTRKYLEKLLGDPMYWWKCSLHGMRTVLEHHTYMDRTEYIFRITGHPFTRPPRASFVILVRVRNRLEVDYIMEICEKQLHKPVGVIFVVSGTEEGFRDMAAGTGTIPSKFIQEDSIMTMENLRGVFDSSHLAIFDPSAYYGINYLRDYALAVMYADPDYMGRKACTGLTADGRSVGTIPDSEFRITDSVLASSLVLKRSLAEQTGLKKLLYPDNEVFSNTWILSLDPFNYLSGGNAWYMKDKKGIESLLSI